jgi:phosphate transport system permease protein
MPRERLFPVGAWIFGLAGLALPVAIVSILAFDGWSVVTWEFLTAPPKGFPLGRAGGIGPAITGTCALAGLGLIIAWPVGVGGAVYLSEYARSTRLARAARFGIECLASVPSIVYGLVGYAFLVVALRWRISLASGAVTLAAVMLPVILIGAHAALRSVDPALREGALAMGVTRAHVLRRILLPRAWPGVVAATVLAVGHAAGSAAPVLYTASVATSKGALSLDAPVMTLPTHLYYLVGEGVSPEHAYGTALVLVAGMLLANACALALRRIGR